MNKSNTKTQEKMLCIECGITKVKYLYCVDCLNKVQRNVKNMIYNNTKTQGEIEEKIKEFKRDFEYVGQYTGAMYILSDDHLKDFLSSHAEQVRLEMIKKVDEYLSGSAHAHGVSFKEFLRLQSLSAPAEQDAICTEHGRAGCYHEFKQSSAEQGRKGSEKCTCGHEKERHFFGYEEHCKEIGCKCERYEHE